MNNLTIAAQTIKDTISAQDVGRAIGLEIRHGRCRCPIHGGKDFNCVLYSGNRGFYCHVCKSGGDVLSFAQQYYKMSFKECIAWFNDAFHMGLELGTNISTAKRREAENAIRRRKNAIEFREWKDRMAFNQELTADEIVRRLEDIRDENAPKKPNEPWSVAFRMAVGLLPEARRFAEDCAIECIKERQT